MIDELNYEIRSAVIIGAGNVAGHLGRCLRQHGITISQIFNRTKSTGELLAHELNAGFESLHGKIAPVADLCLVAVSDDVIDTVISQCHFDHDILLVHTAGAIDMDVLKGKARNIGVLYPLQTFTKGRPLDFRKIPFFIEGNNDLSVKALKNLAGKISDFVHDASSPQRMYLHLAAVISSNFTNHLLADAEMILENKGYQLDILKPLMLETIEKAFSISPKKAQTGPAIRNNHKVIEKHLDMLKNFPDIREIYRILSENISRTNG